jgi:hypothetical protein
MAEYFKNFVASSRRDNMKRFGHAQASADLSWIADAADIQVADLSPQIDSIVVAFTLPVAASFVQELLWNNAPVYADTLSPGFTHNGTTGITTNFVPALGDTLIARYWPA